MKKKIIIIFLTFNSQKTIRNAIKAAFKITKDVCLIDSFSTDKTIEICKKFNCKIIYRKFKNYSDQRNWAINKFKKKFIWQLHLDSDEILDHQAIKSIKNVIKEKKKNKVFVIRRKNYFLNTQLNYPGINNWHLRLFRSHDAKCEKKLYDQHFISKKKVYKIDGYIIENDKLNLKNWKIKHEKWAKLSAKEYFSKKKIKNFSSIKDPRYVNRFKQQIYYLLPLNIRPIIYFFYRYILKLGFLDGKIGLLFCFYHAFWFRLKVDNFINFYKKKKI